MHAQLAAARHRVLDDLAWPDRPADQVNDSFDAAIRRLADAKVRTFLPILVERAVRAQYARDGAERPVHPERSA